MEESCGWWSIFSESSSDYVYLVLLLVLVWCLLTLFLEFGFWWGLC